MADVGLTRRSARELARLIRAGAVSPVEVLDAHLAVIEAVNPKLNAIVTLAAEEARADARLAEIAVGKGEPLGPLHGLPVAIKDITSDGRHPHDLRFPAIRRLCPHGRR